ncbi:MAG: acyl-CoA thioesterase [Burkholderiaceae bacterium]|nr:acyl-CoA thioesterase [Burkholderiaceae bacterium]
MHAGVVVDQPLVGNVFQCAMSVRWGDLDALNHVNNAVYSQYFEEARIQLFGQAGIVLPSARNVVLAHASCDFLRPVLYPANVVVSLVLLRVGRSSMELETLLECQESPGVVYARGKNVIVAIDAASGQSSPWTAEELAKFSRCFVAGAAS